MSEDIKDEELKKEDEALKAEQTRRKDQASGTGEAKETETSNDIPETQEGAPDETEKTGETEGGTEQAPVGGEGEKKGFFKKKKDLRDEKIKELTGRIERQMTESGNFRKRTDKEKSAMYEVGARDIIERILPVIDNFEKGLATVPEDAKETPLAGDMEKIHRQFRKTLREAGVKAIEAVGQRFDPNYHNTVMHVDDDSLGENTMTGELQKGYMYRDSVVGHSMVKVAN